VISRIEVLRYRVLRYVSQRIDAFQILVGPNASGKSSFLDAVAFLGDMLRGGPTKAILGDRRAGIPQRAPDPTHLFWMRKGPTFQVAVELAIPEERRFLLKNGGYSTARYEVAIGLPGDREQVGIVAETLWLLPEEPAVRESPQRALFPAPPAPPDSLVAPPGKKTPPGWKKVVNKVEESGNDYFFSETSGWNNPFRLGPAKSALANLPEDEARFPDANGLEAPSWLVSDGTLRLLALTLLAYAPEVSGVYLIEEPENGIHPRAVEVMFQSLTAVYGAQILCATHSPVVLSMAKPEQVLCFARDESGATDIVRGSSHPKLKAWKGEVDLGTLFAGGVMG
jgi:hypothetical protein